MPKEEKQEPNYDEIEVFEFSLTEKEVDDLILKLEKLKKTKTNFSFQVDEDNEFIINYADYDGQSSKKDLDKDDEEFYEEEK